MGAPIVTVTLPDGKQEKFEVEASPHCKTSYVVLDVELSFKALSGTDAELEVIDGKQARYLNAQLVEKNLFSYPINPQKYKLTTKSGYQYYIDQSKGLEKVITPNLQTVTYSSDGIYHSDGSALLFKRDSKGRITSIIDPNNNEYTYTYSDKGDLVAAVTPLKEKTTYTYNKAHGLLDIIDPLAHRLVRNIYDDNGRLIAQEDNEGNKKTFEHDIDGRQSVITDRNNRTTIFYYDEYGHVTTKVDAKDQTWQYKYDKDGNQLEQINPLGFSTTASYDDHSNLLTQTDGEGNTTSFTYNKRGQELTITDALNRTYSNTYDSAGNLLTVKGPIGKVSGNNINAKGLVSSTVDVLGYETKFTYDDKGNKLTETNPLGDVVRYTYDDNGNVLTELRTRTDGDEKVTEVTRYTYDVRNRVIATEEPDGSITRNEYDMAGNLIAEIDALSRRTEHTYDAYGRLLETCYPDGSCESKRYDWEGNVLEETDRLNRTTSYEYDELNRPVKTIYADKTYSSTDYDAAGRVSSETDARGNTKTYVYDKADRRTAIIDANDNKHSIVYNDVDLIESETDANNNTTTYEYNALGQRIKTIFNDKSYIEEEYDDKGILISKTDANKRKTTFKHDKLGRLIKVIDAKNQETTYTYDEVGNKLSQTDAENRTTKWRYDSQGRVLSRVLPLAQSEFYIYDAAGNMLSHVDFNGAVKKYTYDTNNRITQVDYSNGSSEKFTYNALNRLSAKNNAGETKYQHDDLNRLQKEIQPGGITLSYEYDAGGNRTKITTTKDQYSIQTRYKFDALNRLEWVEDNDGGKTVYEYDPVGNRIKQLLPNGVVTNYVYDSLNRLTELSSYNAQKQLITDYVYTLEATGRRSEINEHHSGRVINYVYDELYRLTDENIKDGVNGNYVASYKYDKVGNRTESIVNGVVTQYRYDANDRLEKQGGVDYQYDNNGNTINETEDGVTTNYTYDPADRLISVERDGALTEYGYNSDGIRIRQKVAGNDIHFVVDSNRDYAEVLSEWVNGQPQVNYTHADELLSQQRGSKASYYLYDGHGSVRELSDKDGIVTDNYDYDAFGVDINNSGSTENSYRYTGEQYDSTLDKYYLRARYYDHNIGRFSQMDSWTGNNQDPVTLHKYAYGNVDPVNHIDPSGHFGLVEFGIANNIRNTLAEIQSDFGMSLLDSAMNPEATEASSGDILMGLAVMGGETAFKMLRLLSGKFRKVCDISNSFEADTLIATENGLVPIQDIRIDDKVWAYNETTGKQTLQPVVHLIEGSGSKNIVDIRLANGETLSATSGHPFYVNGEWKDAGELSIHDVLQRLNGQPLSITGLLSHMEQTKVYNFTVANDHNYYVGEGKVLTHNTGGCRVPVNYNWDHILFGNFNRKGDFGGLHHVEGGIIPSNRVVRKNGVESGDFYEAYVSADKNLTSKMSTFFPDDWSRETVKSVINEGIIKTYGKGGELKMSALSPGAPSNVWLRIVIKGDTLVTAHPIIKK